jgi:sRNA-binding carbon storage regulator CsrA
MNAIVAFPLGPKKGTVNRVLCRVTDNAPGHFPVLRKRFIERIARDEVRATSSNKDVVSLASGDNVRAF